MLYSLETESTEDSKYTEIIVELEFDEVLIVWSVFDLSIDKLVTWERILCDIENKSVNSYDINLGETENSIWTIKIDIDTIILNHHTKNYHGNLEFVVKLPSIEFKPFVKDMILKIKSFI